MAANTPPARVWRPIFLEALAETGNVKLSAETACVNRRTAYRGRKSSDKFAREWDEAMEEATDLLKAEARRRAFNGVQEPVFYKGKKVDTVTKYSDTLLIFLLKAHDPAMFRDNIKVEHAGSSDGPPPVFHLVPVQRQPDDGENTDDENPEEGE